MEEKEGSPDLMTLKRSEQKNLTADDMDGEGESKPIPFLFLYPRYPRNPRSTSLKVGDIVVALRLLSHDAFPIQARVLEVKQESELQARDVQVSEHLRNVRFGKCRHDFWVNDNGAVDDQIRNRRADQLTAVKHGEGMLHFYGVAPSPQLNDHRVLVENFIKPWLKLIENLHRDPNDGSAQLLVKYFAHGGTGF
jgi:hypothetical protein